MKILPALLNPLLLISFLLISTQVLSQSEESFRRTDVVYLKNGSIFKGQIESYEMEKELRLKIDVNSVLIFKADNIKKVIQQATKEEIGSNKIVKEYAFREKGLYYTAHLGYIGGNDQFGEYTNGFNAHFSTGYQLKRLIGLGIGTGVDFYNIDLGSVIPVYVEARGYLKAANMSPFYSLAAGVGFPVKSDNDIFTESQSGYYFSPSLGFRLGGSSEANTTIALGLQWQKITYSHISDTGSLFEWDDTYIYKRFNFKVGVIF